jgi:hypothetical protein
VRGHAQAALWQAAFGGAHFRQLTAQPHARIADPMSMFVARAGDAACQERPRAADRLAAWCALAGLPATCLAPPAHPAHLLAFAARANPSPRRLAAMPAALAFQPMPHLCPYHGFFPAAWPVASSASLSFLWPVLWRGGGLGDLRLGVHIDRTAPCAVTRVSIAAHRWRNGQILSTAPLASFGQTVPQSAADDEAELWFDAALPGLPPPGDSNDAAYLLLLRVELRTGSTSTTGGCLITPSLRADPAAALILPSLRLAITALAWVPIVADPLDEDPARREALLRLNAPALHTLVAILPDTGDDVRDSARFLLEQLIAPMARRPLQVRVQTQKHLGPGYKISRATREGPVQSLLQGALWRKLFEAENHYQTVRLDFMPEGAAYGLAGLLLQASLRDEQGDHQAGARYGGHTISISFWAVAEPSAMAAAGLDHATLLNRFTAWVRGAAPLQAWAADCAWVPEFDYCDHATLTPYEVVSQVDWARPDLQGALTDRAWLRRRLRFVAPLLWLGWELAEHVDTAALTTIAAVHSIDDGVEIALRSPLDQIALEKLLAPVLPLGV